MPQATPETIPQATPSGETDSGLKPPKLPPATETGPAEQSPEQLKIYQHNLNQLFRDDGEVLELDREQKDCIESALTRYQVATLAQGRPGQEGTTEALGCLDHDGDLRFYMQQILYVAGELETSSSDCIRRRFEGEDISQMMDPTDQQARDAASYRATLQTGATLLILSCMTPKELASIPGSPIGPDDREKAQCIIELHGGEENILSSIRKSQGQAQALFLEKGTQCGLIQSAR